MTAMQNASASLARDTEAACALIRRVSRDAPRCVIAIAGPPASGKSTLAEAVVAQLNVGQTADQPKAALLPMDGFHLDNRLLAPLGLLPRKGAPKTFDAEGFCAALRDIAVGGRDICHPIFDRTLDLAIANAGQIKAETPIVVVEGNYLFLSCAPWNTLRDVFAATVFVAPEREVLRARLVRRWLDHGLDPAAAEARATANDLVNADYVLRHSTPADLTLGGA